MRRERALKIVVVLVGLLFCAATYPLVLMAKQDPALAMMMSLYVPWRLSAARIAQPIRAPQPDSFHGVVELCACSSHGTAGITRVYRSSRDFRSGYIHCDWSSPDLAGPGKAAC